MSDVEIVQVELMVKMGKLEAIIEELARKCRSTERQFAMLIRHHEHLDGMVQEHENILYHQQDDHK